VTVAVLASPAVMHRIPAFWGTPPDGVFVAAILPPAVIFPSWGQVLAVLGGATTLGMAVAAVLLLLAVRRHAGRDALQGLPLTLAVVIVGVALGALLGRLLPLPTAEQGIGAMADAVGRGIQAGTLAAVVVVAVAMIDPALRRTTVTAARKLANRFNPALRRTR
jgi:putative peptidoglycan lipid II flippase